MWGKFSKFWFHSKVKFLRVFTSFWTSPLKQMNGI